MARATRKNPVTATAAQVFEKARQSGYPTQGFTAQQLVDAMWPNGEVRLRGSGAKITRRGRTHSALQERKMVGNPRGLVWTKTRSEPARTPKGVRVIVGTRWEAAPFYVIDRKRLANSPSDFMFHLYVNGVEEGAYYSVQTAKNHAEAMEVPLGNPRDSKATRRSQATHSRLLTRGKKVSKAAVGEVYYTKTGQPYVKDAAGRPRFISRDEAAAHVTHEDLVDAGLRWNPAGLIWKQVQTTTVLRGRQRLTVGSRWAAPGGWEIERVPVSYSHHDCVFQLRSTHGVLGDFPSLHEAKRAAELF